MLHHTQKSTGVIARRQASVLLAKDPVELENAYNDWAKTYDLLHMDTKQQLDGVDLSKGMLEQSRKRRLYRNLIKADFTRSNCIPNSYDAVHASAVFAPGQAPPSTFDEFWLLIKTNGHAVFTIRCGYYDSDEGRQHKEHLESMIKENKWKLISKTKQDYLPKDDVFAYVFVLKKILS